MAPVTAVEKPVFNYDLDVFNQIKYYLEEKNHHGLALIARQKGVPPFLRFKVWPLLLKTHPFVLLPFIQPDCHQDDDDGAFDVDEVERSIGHDLRRYVQRLHYLCKPLTTIDPRAHQIIHILHQAVLKFAKKWSRIIKYDPSLTWIALNLAEWLPPVENTPWVLCGRDHKTPNDQVVTNVIDDYSNYIDHIPGLAEFMNDLVEDTTLNTLNFSEVYERLVLVLLHCPEQTRLLTSLGSLLLLLLLLLDRGAGAPLRPEPADDDLEPRLRLVLPLNGGTIEDRVAYFIYCFRKLLPELANYFSDEQILTRFGSQDDEWLIWWLKYAGLKVWLKFDRGRIWDLLLGWRLVNPKRTMQYYFEKLNISRAMLAKLGPDLFWLVRNDDDDGGDDDSDGYMADNLLSTTTTTTGSLNPRAKNSLFRDLVTELNNKLTMDELYLLLPGLALAAGEEKLTIPFSTLDPQFELIFILLALLKLKENILVELDQHEIRQFLSRLPPKAYKFKVKEEVVTTSTEPSPGLLPPLISSEGALHSLSLEPMIIRNDFLITDYKVDFMDNIINEAGDLWRQWMWREMVDDR